MIGNPFHRAPSGSAFVVEWLNVASEVLRVLDRRRVVNSLKSTIRERIGLRTGTPLVIRVALKPDKLELDDDPLSHLLR